MGIKIPDEAETNMGVIDGFYFTTRYPGADSFYAHFQRYRKKQTEQ